MKAINRNRKIKKRIEGYRWIVPRGPAHHRALETLELKCKSGDFSALAAARAGVNSAMVKELVGLRTVLVDRGRYRLNDDGFDYAREIEIPVHHQRHDSQIVAKYPPLARSKRRPESLAFARTLQEPETPLDLAPESMHIFKRFRLPFSLYALLRPKFGNLSAYIRYLIYADLGMTDHAARELKRSRPRH